MIAAIIWALIVATLIVWMVLTSKIMDELADEQDEFRKDMMNEFKRVSDGFKTSGMDINSKFEKTENKLMSALQSKSDSTKSHIDNVKAALGDVRGSWNATGNEIIEDSGPELPTVAERLTGIEERLGIHFVHSVKEERGYQETPTLECSNYDICGDCSVAEYPVTERPVKKSKKANKLFSSF